MPSVIAQNQGSIDARCTLSGQNLQATKDQATPATLGRKYCSLKHSTVT